MNSVWVQKEFAFLSNKTGSGTGHRRRRRRIKTELCRVAHGTLDVPAIDFKQVPPKTPDKV